MNRAQGPHIGPAPPALPRACAVDLIGPELEMTADVALHLQADDAELTRRLQTVH